MESQKSTQGASPSLEKIPGRGGATLTLIRESETELQILISGGASREEQFDDFWIVTVNKATKAPTKALPLKISEKDGFTPRNSMTSVFDKERNRVIFFGGQDSEKGELYNDLFSLSLSNFQLTHHDYDNGAVTPAVRNSHTMTLSHDGKSAYLFGGANQDGPLKDLYKLDLETLKFKPIKTDESEKLLPAIEMHTAELYQQDKLLIVGGRVVMYKMMNEERLGKVSVLGNLPSDLCSQVSRLVNDEHLVIYGGTNGLRFFDSIVRYSITSKKWTLMTKIPQNCKKSRFFQEGRISCASLAVGQDMLIVFGGSSIEKECNDFLIIPLEDTTKDENFSEINEIM